MQPNNNAVALEHAELQTTPTVSRTRLFSLGASCAQCAVRAFCLPGGCSHAERDTFNQLISQRMRIKKGAALYHSNDPLTYLYAVRMGCFKISLIDAHGRGMVADFMMAGEVMGLDAISTSRYACSALALEDSEVCPIPYHQIEQLARNCPALQQALNRLMSRQIVRDNERLLMMCNMNADERFAAFLLQLSQRYAMRGYSALGFVLRMTREDIASYLGLRLETICRCMARLRDLQIVRFAGREVEILDMPALMAMEHHWST